MTDSRLVELTLFPEAAINNTLASLGPTLAWFAWPPLVCHFQAHVSLCQLCGFLVYNCTFLHTLKLIIHPIFNKFISITISFKIPDFNKLFVAKFPFGMHCFIFLDFFIFSIFNKYE